jgi:hypothetical protein
VQAHDGCTIVRLGCPIACRGGCRGGLGQAARLVNVFTSLEDQDGDDDQRSEGTRGQGERQVFTE